VLFISLGNGRSGSTLLDTILNSTDETVGIGQLSTIADDHTLPCSCGKVSNECDFWGNVFKLYEQKTGDAGRVRLKELEQKFERDTHFFKLLFARYNKTEFNEYKKLTLNEFEAIAEVSGKNTILDSSKMVARSINLVRMKELDVNIIHLIRDGRGLLWSSIPRGIRDGYDHNSKTSIYPTFANMLRFTKRWTITNLSIYFFDKFRLFTNYHLVKYENYISEPLIRIKQICDFLDIDFDKIKENLENQTPFKIGHILSGNPEIKSMGTVNLDQNKDSKHNLWQSAFPFSIQLLHYTLGLPTYIIFKYKFKVNQK